MTIALYGVAKGIVLSTCIITMPKENCKIKLLRAIGKLRNTMDLIKKPKKYSISQPKKDLSTEVFIPLASLETKRKNSVSMSVKILLPLATVSIIL